MTRTWEPPRVQLPPSLPPDLPFQPINLQTADLSEMVAQCEIDHAVGPVLHTPGGSVAGYQRWERFRDQHLSAYARVRNNPLAGGVSRLSPYLHYGMVAPQRVGARSCSAWRRRCRQVSRRVTNLAGNLPTHSVFIATITTRRPRYQRGPLKHWLPTRLIDARPCFPGRRWPVRRRKMCCGTRLKSRS